MEAMMRIPKEVQETMKCLEERGFEAYIVGGCVRDMLLGRDPLDWDLTTNATPEQIQEVFEHTFYENKFWTVTVLTGSKDEILKGIEITTYRAEGKYTDKRHPEEIRFAKTVEEDLSRRDFTVNAMALRVDGRKRIMADPFGGEKDLEAKLIRAVGNPEERFAEDALRMMRAARIATVLGFGIEENTKKAIQSYAGHLSEISQERIRDEFVKIIMADRATEGIELLRELGLLHYIIPELEEGWEVGQNKHHIYSVWEHNLKSLEYAVSQDWSLNVRIASLLHDVAKPRVKKGEGYNSTFYGHEVVGGSMTRKILDRMKFPKKDVEHISQLVRLHLFYYNVGEVTEASVRRLIRKIGMENMEDLLQVRMADRIGSGVPKAEPYKLRHLRYLIEKVSKDPISPKMVKMNGEDLMKLLCLDPGPKVGYILAILLGEVLDDPKKNEREYLEVRAKALGGMKDEALRELAKESEKLAEGVEEQEDQAVKEKYWVR